MGGMVFPGYVMAVQKIDHEFFSESTMKFFLDRPCSLFWIGYGNFLDRPWNCFWLDHGISIRPNNQFSRAPVKPEVDLDF